MRTTVYAAFTGDGTPLINLWDFNKGRLNVLLSDRKANGEASEGEHAVRLTIDLYNRLLAERGWTWARIINGGAR